MQDDWILQTSQQVTQNQWLNGLRHKCQMVVTHSRSVSIQA